LAGACLVDGEHLRPWDDSGLDAGGDGGSPMEPGFSEPSGQAGSSMTSGSDTGGTHEGGAGAPSSGGMLVDAGGSPQGGVPGGGGHEAGHPGVSAGVGGALAQGGWPDPGTGGHSENSGGAAGEGSEAGGPSNSGGAGDAGGSGGSPDVIEEPPIHPHCADYVEIADAANLRLGKPEITGHELFPDAPFTLCARFNAGHFDSATGVVDGDSFEFMTTGPYSYLVTLDVADPSAISRVEVSFDVLPFGYVQETVVLNGRAIIPIRPDRWGKMRIFLEAFNDAGIAVSVPYRLHFYPDEPLDDCLAVKAANASQTYTEAGDVPLHRGNDILRPSYWQNATAFTPHLDHPEPSGVVLDVGDRALLTGTSAQIDYGEDDVYFDGDMYAFSTGDATQLTVRIDVPNAPVDMDMMLYREGELERITYGMRLRTEIETLTVAVQPNTAYWLWVATDHNSPWYGSPWPYSVTLCGQSFTP
jgi:hypothetical protein